MSYHIPSDEQVQKALKKIFSKRRTINSQIKLKNLVEKELKTKDKKYGVSNTRLRNIAIYSDFIKLEIHSREGDPHKTMNKCPVCGHSFKNVKNLTIYGGEVTIEFRCDNCGYWTGKKKRIPTRYVFQVKKK
jgi:DNA repair exonuclease SbcCD ATPase subunit